MAVTHCRAIRPLGRALAQPAACPLYLSHPAPAIYLPLDLSLNSAWPAHSCPADGMTTHSQHHPSSRLVGVRPLARQGTSPVGQFPLYFPPRLRLP